MTAALYALGAYLLGSIPFAILVSRAMGLADPRTYGSGNIGATNVLRSGNRRAALLTLLGDAAKGWVAVLVARWLGAPVEVVALVAFFAFVGHVFPVWLKFNGGKGVATTLGTLIAANWMVGIGACLVWLIMAVLFRYSSLSALIAVAAAPFLALWVGTVPQAFLAAFAAVLVWIRHHENIRRLLKGEEPKIGKKKTAAP